MRGDLIRIEAWAEESDLMGVKLVTTMGYYEQYFDIGSLDVGIHEWDFFGVDEE